VPPEFAEVISAEAHRKAADYTVARTRFSRIDIVLEAVVLLGWTLGGGLAWVDGAWRALDWPPVATGIGVLLTIAAVGAVIDLPFRIWRTFVIEERFGFNRTTPATFAADQLKGACLLLLLGGPLAAVILWLMHAAGDGWWLYAWAVWLGFNLLMVWAWPAFIAPLFNRFTPLEDESLRHRIDALLEPEVFAPAPGQGALGLLVREEDDLAFELAYTLQHRPSFDRIRAERAFAAALPDRRVGALATVSEEGEMTLFGAVATDGTSLQAQVSGDAGEAEQLGNELAQDVQEQLAAL
jgi:hypothetical protein